MRSEERGARPAMLRATAVLAVATLVYYGLVLVGTKRWLAGGAADGLRDVAFMTGVWLVASLVAGPVFGYLGHLVRTAPAMSAAVALGLACGLLASEGWSSVQVPPWRLLALTDPFANGYVAAQAVRIQLPLLVLVWLATAHRLWRAWPCLLGAAVVAGSVGVLAWRLLGRVALMAG
ncbi:hypothetical protein JIG36_00005 [Actinoplanes sp. LDG1-06]|uniref:Uncharacterized protein n=1 Tax=Paractinoplanes ovalisporus TaxID=2810368 RepID=A0ABS2A261_9ACTN|nr:DUF6518 family protein [Actinoplanes ovalisporus]MBM2613936.1 hypothetical protein [Actinoplanes ovalisporus]